MPVTIRRGRPRACGFTLVELLITLSLVGLVGVVMVRMMLGQSRVVQRSTEQLRVREGLRRGMDLLSADLRSLSPAQGDVMNVTSNSLTVRTTIGSGVVCGVTGTTSVDLVPEDAAKAPMTFFADLPVVGDTLRLLRLSDNSWHELPITGVSSGTTACPSGSSVFVTDADASRSRTRLTATLPTGVAAGDLVRITRPVRYTVAQEGSGTWYIARAEYRASTWQSTVVAGPFRSSTSAPPGLQVTLFNESGVALTTATRHQAARAALILRGIGKASSAGNGPLAGAVTDSLVLSVAFRNR